MSAQALRTPGSPLNQVMGPVVGLFRAIKTGDKEHGKDFWKLWNTIPERLDEKNHILAPKNNKPGMREERLRQHFQSRQAMSARRQAEPKPSLNNLNTKRKTLLGE